MKTDDNKIKFISLTVLVILIILLVAFQFLIHTETDEDKITKFVTVLSNAYNTRVLSENNGDEVTLQQKFPLYTSARQTLEVIVAHQKIEDTVANGGAYFIHTGVDRYDYAANEELLTMFFRRIDGNSPKIIYDARLKVDNVIDRLGYLGVIGESHTLLSATEFDSPSNSLFYPTIIGFPLSEVLNDSAKHGVIAGQGIYAFHKDGGGNYIKINYNFNAIVNSDIQPIPDTFLESVLKQIRNTGIFRLYEDNQTIINFFAFLLMIISFSVIIITKVFKKHKKKK
jgi:hypothetical protein